MPMISWNEVRDRAIRFSREWAEASREQADKQTFWNEFFAVFGIPRKSVARFEASVARDRGTHGFIDVFWPGRLIVEHKSRGASFARAESQAFDYCADLIRQGRHEDVPQYIIICDFARFSLYDLEPDPSPDVEKLEDGRPFRLVEFELQDLHKKVREFAFIRGDKPVRLVPEHPANMKATQLLADLHDAIEDTGYSGHALERYLVRCLFCLFAEDTGVFEPFAFYTFICRSKEDGSDLGGQLTQLWEVLNTPVEKRQKTLDEELTAFPYVNGGLFAEHLPTCSFNARLRESLLECARFYWARISPAVFGSIFQGVMDARERRQIGAHYTSERDIMKLLNGLFLDELRDELQAALADRSTRRDARLTEFQEKLRGLRFFDPACGCGNFLILAYRELRRMEQEVLVALYTAKGRAEDWYKVQTSLDVRDLSKVNVDQFYGIEIGEWPVRIAEVGLWLADHQCNQELGEALGQTFRRLPIKASPTLRVANALRTDWKEVLPPSENVFVLGNPPFVGKKEQNPDQKADMKIVWGDTKGSGVLDYVTCWHRKAAEYVRGTQVRCAFVSTNSITQGEQVGLLWNHLSQREGIKIHFAHRTFSWASEARGKAHVHVVIIGFGAFDRTAKTLFEYDRPEGDATSSVVRNINPYLVEGPVLSLLRRDDRICSSAPEMMKGSEVTDDGFLLLTTEEKDELTKECGRSSLALIRRFVGGNEFINGLSRWCLWLRDVPPERYRGYAPIRNRLEAVRAFRKKSPKPRTVELAASPHLFGEDRQPATTYLLIPKVSSERRYYIPIGFMPPDVIVSGSALAVPNAEMFHFGVLSSRMHMAWMRQTCGRMKSDYQYSVNIVYNNFPWPESPMDKDRAAVEVAAQAVLDARAKYPDSTLADLYDPLAMPAPLVKAHAALDKAVDRCYRKTPFASDRERVEHLFALYEKLTTPLIPKPSNPSKPRKPATTTRKRTS